MSAEAQGKTDARSEAGERERLAALVETTAQLVGYGDSDSQLVRDWQRIARLLREDALVPLDVEEVARAARDIAHRYTCRCPEDWDDRTHVASCGAPIAAAEIAERLSRFGRPAGPRTVLHEDAADEPVPVPCRTSADAVAALCALQAEVVRAVYGFERPNDCFCRNPARGGTLVEERFFRSSGEGIGFIVWATRRALARFGAAGRGEGRPADELATVGTDAGDGVVQAPSPAPAAGRCPVCGWPDARRRRAPSTGEG